MLSQLLAHCYAFFQSYLFSFYVSLTAPPYFLLFFCFTVPFHFSCPLLFLFVLLYFTVYSSSIVIHDNFPIVKGPVVLLQDFGVTIKEHKGARANTPLTLSLTVTNQIGHPPSWRRTN